MVASKIEVQSKKAGTKDSWQWSSDGKGKFDAFSASGADHWYSMSSHRARAINNEVAQSTFNPGWLRSVGPGWIAWSLESFIDEIAHKQGKDPVQFRIEMLDGGNGSSTPNVLETFELYGAYVENVNYNTLAYATSDPATITMSVRYDNAIQTPQGTGIGTAVARTIGTLSTGGGQ